MDLLKNITNSDLLSNGSAVQKIPVSYVISIHATNCQFVWCNIYKYNHVCEM